MDSSGPIVRGTVMPLSNWRKIWGQSATADNGGNAINDPYDCTQWTLSSGTVGLAAAMAELHDNGRLMESLHQQGEVWLWALCTAAAAATARFRCWGLGTAPRGPVEIGPIKSKLFLGPAVRLFDPSSGQDYIDVTAPASAGSEQRLKLSFDDYCEPYRDSGGTLYYSCGNPWRMDGPAVPWHLVTCDSASGQFIVLAKTR